MKSELLCLKWGTWELSLSRLPHPWPHWAPCCLNPSLALDMDTCDHFPEPDNMALSRKCTTILNLTFLSWGVFPCCSIIFLMSSLALPSFNIVSLEI